MFAITNILWSSEESRLSWPHLHVLARTLVLRCRPEPSRGISRRRRSGKLRIDVQRETRNEEIIMAEKAMSINRAEWPVLRGSAELGDGSGSSDPYTNAIMTVRWKGVLQEMSQFSH